TLKHDRWVNSAAFSPDSQKIVTRYSNTAKVWDVQGQALATLTHDSDVNSAAFSPDSQKIVTASYKTAKVWDVQGQALATLKHDRWVNSAAFSPDSQKIVTRYSNTAKVWDVQGQALATLTHDDRVNSAAFSPDSQKIVTRYSNTAKVWDVQGQALATLKHDRWVNSAAFSPDSQKIVTASYKTAKVWDTQGNELAMLGTPFWGKVVPAFSYDGSKVVTTSSGGTTTIWDVYQKKAIMTLKGHQQDISYLAFSPDDALLVTTSRDKTAKVWNGQGKLLTTLNEHKEAVSYAALSPNSQRIVTASDDNTAKVWNIKGELLGTLQHSDNIKFVMFSLDGSQIMTMTKHTVKLWPNFFVDDLLQSNHLAKLTLEDEILAGVITLEEVPEKQLLTMASSLKGIAQFYENQADQSDITENQIKYLQLAATIHQKIGPPMDGQRTKAKLTELTSSESPKSQLPELSESRPSLQVWQLVGENIALIIGIGLLILVMSRQQQVFFQQQNYLPLVIYSLVPVVMMVSWLSLREGAYLFSMIEEQGIFKNVWLFGSLLIVFSIAGFGFFQTRKRFQNKQLRTLLRLLYLILLVLSSGFVLLLLYQWLYLHEIATRMSFVMSFVIFVGVVGVVILPLVLISLVYYALQPSNKWWKWPLKKVSMLLAYISLLIVTTFLTVLFDNALAFYNPISTGLRFLLLLIAGIILIQALFSQYKAHQRRWFTRGAFATIYSVILLLLLMGFWNEGAFTFTSSINRVERVVFYYEISDALTLLLAAIATGFATVWAIQTYKSQNHRVFIQQNFVPNKDLSKFQNLIGIAKAYLDTYQILIYALVALFLLGNVIYFFRAYMMMMAFFTMAFGGILLFIHSVSQAFDNRRKKKISTIEVV
ncbi:WD40 repeat domain-containing protein, partial [Candidatus Parabeggiatoa sp. HSG14]|uniref:WD40 repeat domain-containing protein n=1 Tax=Candidatus Parabeggiatoa sp. HSG14 TaxID=3055593 RepID=UPI0025A75A09|nr:WD40 repeat domain-containing protein [Thiotrichales bacterium HSG14]